MVLSQKQREELWVAIIGVFVMYLISRNNWLYDIYGMFFSKVIFHSHWWNITCCQLFFVTCKRISRNLRVLYQLEVCTGQRFVGPARWTTSSPPVSAECCHPPGHITSHQCYSICTGCQSVSESCSRSRGSCISRSLEQLPCTSLTTVAFCRTLVITHCGLIPMTCGSCLCREHIINLVIGVSRLPVLDSGTIFHPV